MVALSDIKKLFIPNGTPDNDSSIYTQLKNVPELIYPRALFDLTLEEGRSEALHSIGAEA